MTAFWKLNQCYNLKVDHGTPFAQPVLWLCSAVVGKVKVDRIVPNSPVVTMACEEACKYYFAMGPHITTVKDTFAIVTKWCEFVPKIFDDYPHLLAKMLATYNHPQFHGLGCQISR
jgi:hypothetical protein